MTTTGPQHKTSALDEWCSKEAARIIEENMKDAESKPSLIRPLGYETPGEQQQTGPADATSTIASSSGTRELKKQKMDDMPDPVAARSLFQEGDEEMLCDEEMKRRREQKAAPPRPCQLQRRRETAERTSSGRGWATCWTTASTHWETNGQRRSRPSRIG